MSAHTASADTIRRGASRRLAMVGSQQSAESFDADNLALVPFVLWLDDLVDALVYPLMMIVLEILGQDVPQLLFGEEDQVTETLLFDGSHEAFRVGIQIGAAWGQFHWLHPGGLENTLKLGRIQWVAVMDQVLLASEEASVTAYVSSDLRHPGTVGLSRQAEDLHFASCRVYSEEHHAPDELPFDE